MSAPLQDVRAAPATIRVRHPTAGELELVAPRFALESGGLTAPAPPQPLGRHTREVLREAALDEGHIAELEERGVIQSAT